MKQSPYFNINYGWPYGADAWDTGMNENLLVLSFLNTHEVDGILPTPPSTEGVSGESYVISSDNSARFFADGTWHIVYPSSGWEFTSRETGESWVYQDNTLIRRANPDDLSNTIDLISSQVDDIEDRLVSIDSSLESLVGIPQRVESLEQNSIDQQQFQDLSDIVSTVQDETDNLTTQVAGVTENITALQGSILQLNGAVDEKLESLVAGDGINVDNTDPINPVVSIDTSFLGTAALADVADFDPSGAAGAVETSLTSLINGRMSAAARAAIDALDPATATLSDLITALQS